MKKEALELSLKYSFVTPLTSMVVTKPLGESTDVLHKPREGGPAGFGGPLRHTLDSLMLSSGRRFHGMSQSPPVKGEQHNTQNKHIANSVAFSSSFLSGQFIIPD